MATTFSDDFSTDPSSRWTALSSSLTWSGSALTSSEGDKAQRYNTQLGGLTQYAKVTISGAYPGCLVFRASSSGSDGYYMVIPGQGDGKAWLCRGNNSGWTDDLASASFTYSSGESFAVIITGTSTSTVVRCWRNPTNNTPYDSTHWDSSSDTADATINYNSGTVFEDTGLYIGLGTWVAVTFDNFYGGDFETTETGNPWYYYAQKMRQKLEEKLKRRILIPGFADCMRYGYQR